jgi:hypothetical protein
MPNSKTPVLIMALIMVAIGTALLLCLSTLTTEIHPPTAPAPTLTPTADPLSTISVLFIGVDSLTGNPPTLESVTVVTYLTEVRKFFLFAVSPDTVISPATTSAPAITLRYYYDEDARLHRQAFLTRAALQKLPQKLDNIYAEVDFDRQAVIQTMGRLGPCECMGQAQTGQELLRRFDSLPPSAAQERLHFQADLFKCLLVAAQTQRWDFPKLINSLGRRFYDTRDRATVILEAAPPLAQSEFTIFYTPLNPMITPTPQP